MSEQEPAPQPPPFSSLPLDAEGPPGNAWGRFGATDSLGMLNLLTPSVVARAAQEIKTGVRVSLDWPLNKPLYPSYKREAFGHQLIIRARGDELRVVNDDHLSFNTQCSSQWDGFTHFGAYIDPRITSRTLTKTRYLKEKRYFNNRINDDIVNSSALGIDAWAESGGIVGRGVLLDYTTWAAQKSIKPDPFASSVIPFYHLQQLISEQNITFLSGNILFVRSGFSAAFDKLSLTEQESLAGRVTADFIGVESSEATLQFLWENQFAAVSGDCPSFERSPVTGPHVDERFVLHEWLLAGWGMPIGEMFDLEGLSDICRETG